MSTYGEIRLRVVKLFPGVDPELLDGWLFDRYQEILDKLPWQRLDAQWAFDAPGIVREGTVALTSGSASITGSGTAWAAAMSGRAIRFGNESAYYGFTHVSGTSATLDRPYAGATASGVAYAIFQNVFALPGDVRVLRAVKPIDALPELEKIDRDVFNDLARDRQRVGRPQFYRPFMDDGSGLPQIEVWPVPDAALPIAIEYTIEAPAFGPDTSTTNLPWVRPAAILAGVAADVLRHQKELAAAGEHEARFLRLVEHMVASETHRAGTLKFQLPDRYVAHRARRMMR